MTTELVIDIGSETVTAERPEISLDISVDMPSLEIGVPGPRGPAGPSGTGYTHTQAVPAATWTIAHALGRRPSWVLIPSDSAGQQVFTDMFYPDDQTTIVEWSAPTSGFAFA